MAESIAWDTGEWRDCFHFNPQSHADRHVEAKMSPAAKKNRSWHAMWGVVNPCNALCAGVFRRKADADQFRRDRAGAYVVVRVIVTPIYTQAKVR